VQRLVKAIALYCCLPKVSRRRVEIGAVKRQPTLEITVVLMDPAIDRGLVSPDGISIPRMRPCTARGVLAEFARKRVNRPLPVGLA
jgi:hypothetical protein